MVPVRRTQTWLPDIFNDFFDNTWMEKTNATAPAINIRETETNYEIEVAAPGMTREDFTIKIENNNQLVVSMEKKHEQKEDKKELSAAPRLFCKNIRSIGIIECALTRYWCLFLCGFAILKTPGLLGKKFPLQFWPVALS